mmetsp:Transcript_24254/g.34710  ORF Transcript_24254/g.34710 Transcript_24254/m.34710 type:complete len:314 (-) Transcript_24254:59-1000(-)
MENHRAADDDSEFFIFIIGREVPDNVTHVRIHESVPAIPRLAFFRPSRLKSVIFHNDVERVGFAAFMNSYHLRNIKLPGVKIIDGEAFKSTRLTYIECDKVETIGESAFSYCESLKKISLPRIRSIGRYAFYDCEQMTNAELGEELDTIADGAFCYCRSLKRISIPLKANLLVNDENQRLDKFDGCDDLVTVSLVGGIHRTISYLPFESWRNEMYEEIDRINHLLPTLTPGLKTINIHRWMESVLEKVTHFKAEHRRLLVEATTQIEFPLWSAKLDDEHVSGVDKAQRAECRVSCGSAIIIPNVLAFLVMPVS